MGTRECPDDSVGGMGTRRIRGCDVVYPAATRTDDETQSGTGIEYPLILFSISFDQVFIPFNAEAGRVVHNDMSVFKF